MNGHLTGMPASQMTKLVSLGLYVDSGRRHQNGAVVYEKVETVEASIRRTLTAITNGCPEDEIPGVLGITPQEVKRDVACALALGLITPA